MQETPEYVCVCFRVTVEDFQKAKDENPDMSNEDLKEKFELGTRCSCCLNEGCRKIAKYYDTF
jgi:bacterioferritin-associated ferredoxin